MNPIKSVFNWIDDRVGDIPLISNPFRRPSTGVATKQAIYEPPTLPTINTADAGDAAWRKQMDATLRNLQNQVAQQPRLPRFDIMGNYNRAKSQAEAAVNPLYQKKLNDFLARQGQLRGEKEREIGIRRQGIDIERGSSLEENEVTRRRTAEDVQAALEKIGLGEERFQTQEGEQFDVDRREAARNLAASGLATSGLGRQQLADVTRARNVGSAEQVQEFGNQREAKRLFQTRTFEDMARGDTQANKIAQNKLEGAQFDLDSYLTELAHGETNFRLTSELERGRDIINQTEAFRGQGVQQFLGSLVGSARPQDIALASQIYR